MKRFFYGITAVMLTSAFFTQAAQDHAWMVKLLGIDWKVQFLIEVGVALAATFIGARFKQPQES